MTYPSLLVLKASAGSGKTYSLVFHYIRVALSVPSNEAHYRHILAITFTNAAAGEMKERVLRTLFEISENKASQDLVAQLTQSLNIGQDELTRRAGNTFRHMLHNYSMLSISTIDSFNQRILRSFAFDLRLQSDFTIETDEANFRSELIDHLLSRVGNDEHLTSYILQYTFANLDDNKSWDTRQNLIRTSGLLFNENTARYLKKLSSLTSAQFIDISINLRKFISEKEKTMEKIANSALLFATSNGLKASDFFKGYYYNYFLKISEGKFEEPSKSIIDQTESGSYTSGGKLKTAEGQFIVSHHAELSEYLSYFLNKENWKAFFKAKAVLADLLSVGLLRTMNEIGSDLRREKNLVFVSDFQHILGKVVANNPAPFIYERIGERYHHILFDEFQDTSELQWNNIIPLLENSLSNNRFNLIVGDGKQAIYRWRNGNAQQFTHLPELGSEHRMRQPLFSGAFGEQNLSFNYRSSPTIVEFNNNLYTHLASLYPLAPDTYRDHEQIAFKKQEGYIQLHIVPSGEKLTQNEVWQRMIESVYKNIEEALADGYRYSDIAILTRKGNKESGPIAHYLISQNVPVITRESARLSEAVSATTVMHYLLAINHPLNKGYAVILLEKLSQLAPQDFNAGQINQVARDGIAFIRSKLNHLASTREIQLGGTTYDQVIQFIRCLAIPHDAALDYLLDHLRELSVNKNYSLAKILTWWEEKKDKLYFSGSTEQNAVVLTTIHSSKGLEYPVVIIPFLPAGTPPKSPVWVTPNIEGIELGVARVTNKDENAELFSEIQEEQELSDLDELNLLYVATTRPEDRLYIHSVDKGKSSLTDRLVEFMRTRAVAADENTFTLGSRTRAAHHHVISSVEPLPLPEFQRGRNMLDVKTGEQDMAVSKALNLSSRHGRILHETLSTFLSVPSEDDQLYKVRRMWPALSAEEIKVLNDQVRQVITHPKCVAWFGNPDAIRSEHEIINTEGKIFRPDRVVEFENHIDVIDFKTGISREEHAVQVRQYMDLVANMSSKPVRGFIVYIPDMQIEEVTDM